MHFLDYIMLTKFQFHYSITCRDILYFVFWLPYFHTLWRHQYLICIIQKSWIYLEQEEIWQRGKHYSSSLFKAFQMHLFFNTSIFHFISTLRFQNFFFNSWKVWWTPPTSLNGKPLLSPPTPLRPSIHTWEEGTGKILEIQQLRNN